jgi:hypothetical protein
MATPGKGKQLKSKQAEETQPASSPALAAPASSPALAAPEPRAEPALHGPELNMSNMLKALFEQFAQQFSAQISSRLDALEHAVSAQASTTVIAPPISSHVLADEDDDEEEVVISKSDKPVRSGTRYERVNPPPLTALPKFDHFVEDPWAFLAKFSDVCRAYSHPMSDFFFLIKLCLPSQDQAWFDTLDEQISWDDFQVAFLERFGIANPSVHALEQLMDLRQGSTSVREYADRFKRLLQRAKFDEKDPVMSDVARVMFKRGVRATISQQLTMLDIISKNTPLKLADYITAAITAESSPTHRTHTNSSSNSSSTEQTDTRRSRRQQSFTPTPSTSYDPSKIPCKRCGKVGHWASVCMAPAPINPLRQDAKGDPPKGTQSVSVTTSKQTVSTGPSGSSRSQQSK